MRFPWHPLHQKNYVLLANSLSWVILDVRTHTLHWPSLPTFGVAYIATVPTYRSRITVTNVQYIFLNSFFHFISTLVSYIVPLHAFTSKQCLFYGCTSTSTSTYILDFKYCQTFFNANTFSFFILIILYSTSTFIFPLLEGRKKGEECH